MVKFLSENGKIEFRHYAIQSRLGAKKKIQNLLNSNKEIPDLGKYNSIEEYMNAMSGSGPRIHMVRGFGAINVVLCKLNSGTFRIFELSA